MLFIDSQQYLDLYRMCGGRELLGPLAAVKDRVFINAQVADEVTRNKVGVATRFLADHFKGMEQEFKSVKMGFPNHLFNSPVTNELQTKLKEAHTGVVEVRRRVVKASGELLTQISRSEDDMSRVLSDFCAGR